MEFNESEVKEAYDIMRKLWGGLWTVYTKMEIRGQTITFRADSYYDPVLTFLFNTLFQRYNLSFSINYSKYR
jgi:hypothetical protein